MIVHSVIQENLKSIKPPDPVKPEKRTLDKFMKPLRFMTSEDDSSGVSIK